MKYFLPNKIDTVFLLCFLRDIALKLKSFIRIIVSDKSEIVAKPKLLTSTDVS
jgi:hypothetical protein